MNGLQPFRKPSLQALRHMNSPGNLGFLLGCSFRCFVVTMHLLPGSVSNTTWRSSLILVYRAFLISLDHTLSTFPFSVGPVNGHFYAMFLLQILNYGLDWCVNVCPQLLLTLMCQPFGSYFGALSYCRTIVVQVHFLYAKCLLMCNFGSSNEKRAVICTTNYNNSI